MEPLIVHIDTAVDTASVCLSAGSEILGFEKEEKAASASGFLHPALQRICTAASVHLSAIDAVAVSIGPGSYTGLRIGLAAAKGLCYALQKPLIAIPTLQMMAAAALEQVKDISPQTALCPMIDARRMEVFTALYDTGLNELRPAEALILTEHPFEDLLHNRPVLFFGNGSAKFQPLTPHPQARFASVTADARHLILLAIKAFTQQQFASVAYSEPFYGKAFYSPAPKK